MPDRPVPGAILTGGGAGVHRFHEYTSHLDGTNADGVYPMNTTWQPSRLSTPPVASPPGAIAGTAVVVPADRLRTYTVSTSTEVKLLALNTTTLPSPETDGE